jgi:3D (Asp-Asp-Asp) domain-containing protein
VAVDPKVIPMLTELYIPSYGRAIAGDTGGLIQGKRIDLGFDDDQPVPDIYEWLDVYVLTPVPPADKIRYVLPDWPHQR